MNPGLLWLLRRAPGAWLRGVRGKIGGVKGILVTAAVALVFVMIVAGQIVQVVSGLRDGRAPDVEFVRMIGPPVLLTFLLLLDLSGKGLYFRPAEIDLLFPAPLSRRELLLYQLASRGGVQVLSGLWMSLFLFRHAGTVVGGIVAPVLVFLFLQLSAQIASLAAAAAGERLGGRIRAAVWLAVGGVVAFAVRNAVAGVPPGSGARAAAEAFASSPWMFGLTLPVRPFVEAFAATEWADVALWTSISAAFVAGGVLTTLRLDVAYEEAALATSRKVQERLRRLRSGEGAFLPSEGTPRARGFPRLPRWGGAGPLAHRQFLELVRNPAGALWTSGSVIALVAFFLAIPTFDDDARAHASTTWIAGAAAAMFLPLVIVQGFGFDFRRDLDRMDVFKSLPLRPLAIAAGQVAVPAAIFTATQLVAFALVAAAASLPAWLLVPAALVVFPWNWFTASVDNALFLLLPYRIDPEDPAKVPFIGRLMVTAAGKMACFAVVGGIVATPAAIGVAIGGGAAVALVALSWALLVAAAVGGTFAVALAFRVFDVGRDGA